MRCLAKQTVDRPASAHEILQTLDTIATSGAGQPRRALASRASSRRRLAVLGVAAVIAMLVLASAWWRGRSALAAHVDRSIAVLPLANLSGDKANDYFGEGLAEEMTNALGKAGLRVIGRGTARTLVARGLDAQSIAKQLRVGSVLQGAVQRAGDRLRITVSLISASDGSVGWSEKYDRSIKDVFAVQDEIARSVAGQLRVTLAGPGGTLARTETDDPEAHALYLRGLYLWNRRTARTLHQAIDLFEQAVRRDPNYARAYAGIGLAYVVLPVYDDVLTDSMLSKAVEAARLALAIDSTLSEGHVVLGYASATQFANAAAERSFATALRLDSSFATAHFWNSIVLAHVGRDAEAIREGQRARALEPASLIILSDEGRLLYYVRQYAAADSVARAVLGFDSTFGVALLTRCRTLIELNRANEAITILERVIDGLNVRSSEKLGLLAYAYARAGRFALARSTLAKLPRDTLISAGGMVAAALDALGDRDAAVVMFRRAVAIHDPWILNWGRAAPYDGLRKDARLAPLFAKIEAPD